MNCLLVLLVPVVLVHLIGVCFAYITIWIIILLLLLGWLADGTCPKQLKGLSNFIIILYSVAADDEWKSGRVDTQVDRY